MDQALAHTALNKTENVFLHQACILVVETDDKETSKWAYNVSSLYILSIKTQLGGEYHELLF